VEDAAPAGFESRNVDNRTIHIAHFLTSTGTLDVHWSQDDCQLTDVLPPQTQCVVRDMMGNVIPLQDAPINRFPVYVWTKTIK
jgi:hypothetical protein